MTNQSAGFQTDLKISIWDVKGKKFLDFLTIFTICFTKLDFNLQFLKARNYRLQVDIIILYMRHWTYQKLKVQNWTEKKNLFTQQPLKKLKVSSAMLSIW